MILLERGGLRYTEMSSFFFLRRRRRELFHKSGQSLPFVAEQLKVSIDHGG